MALMKLKDAGINVSAMARDLTMTITEDLERKLKRNWGDQEYNFVENQLAPKIEQALSVIEVPDKKVIPS
jgi:hypothetical protein